MKEIKKISDKEILKTIDEKRVALKEFRLGSSGSKLKDVKAGRNLRKDIARLLTEVSARNNATPVVPVAPKAVAASKKAAKAKVAKVTVK
ncbi:MAG: 50S ribosomal protein L29 [Patescibacteria group bacterium]